MSIVRRNIIANTAGRGWAALLSLAVLPVYIHFLGIEAFGLIGFFLSLTLILQLLDLGLGTALNRQFAQYSLQSGKAQEMHDLLRTLEIIYWLIGIAIGVTIAALAPAIAAYWLKPQQLSVETATQALAMMGIAIAFQWPRALYSGGLMGLQKQVAFNLLSSITATANSLGAVLILWLVSPTLQAYVAWFMAISLVDTLLTGLLLWRSLPKAPVRPTFRPQALAGIWRFAAGMTGISVMSIILTQLDKLILVKVLPLDAFGYYSLASRVAGALSYLTGPICAAFFPRFSSSGAESANGGNRVQRRGESAARIAARIRLDSTRSCREHRGYAFACASDLFYVNQIRWRRRGDRVGHSQYALRRGGRYLYAPALATWRALALVPSRRW